MALTKSQLKQFKEWMEDGNVSKNNDGTYSTQDAQYRNKLKDLNELKKYFKKEFIADEYEHGGSMGSNNKNGKYLDSISSDKKSKILKNIASHYRISVSDAEGEVRDADAEMLYEYITNEALRMDVYNDMDGQQMAKGGGVDVRLQVGDRVVIYPNHSSHYTNSKGEIVQVMPDGKTYEIKIKHSSGNEYVKFDKSELKFIGGKQSLVNSRFANGGEFDYDYYEVYDDSTGKSLMIYAIDQEDAERIAEELDFESFEDGDEYDPNDEEYAKGGGVGNKSTKNTNIKKRPKNSQPKMVRQYFEDSPYSYAKGGGVHTMPNGEVMLDSEHYAKGGFVGKGEMVWKKLNSNERIDFLYKNFTPQITSRSQEILRNKAYNFLPKNVKIVLESKYANVEEYAKGGKVDDNIIDTKQAKNHDEVYNILDKWGNKKRIVNAPSWDLETPYSRGWVEEGEKITVILKKVIEVGKPTFYIWSWKNVYEHGGSMDSQHGIDLFEDYENIPANVQSILNKYEDAFMDGDYKELQKALTQLKKVGYTFEYDLDGQAYDLRPIGTKGKSEMNTFENGGGMEGKKSVKSYFASINLDKLPAQAKDYMNTQILNDSDIDLIDLSDEDFTSIQQLIAESYPQAIGGDMSDNTTTSGDNEDSLEDAIESLQTLLEFADEKERKSIEEAIEALELLV